MAACEEQKRAHSALLYQQQQEEEQQRDAAQAAALAGQRERERRAEAEQEAERLREEVRAARQKVAAYNALVEQDKSPDNKCREQETARLLLQGWSDLDTFKNIGMKAIDIEHLTTIKFNPDNSVLVCHGVFVTNLGQRMIGTLKLGKNVAGDPLITWISDESQDESRYQAPTQAEIALATTGPTVPAARAPGNTALLAEANASSAQLSSAGRGLADRQTWEKWFASLSGDEREGAAWWAAHRSLPFHGPCGSARDNPTADWTAGCLNAEQMLEPFDRLRKTDPQYRLGWNSL